MEEDIFKKCEIDFNKLIDYGFIIEKTSQHIDIQYQIKT